eukprot:3707986-Lingulodinium_polyedra.AAC.1
MACSSTGSNFANLMTRSRHSTSSHAKDGDSGVCGVADADAVNDADIYADSDGHSCYAFRFVTAY